MPNQIYNSRKALSFLRAAQEVIAPPNKETEQIDNYH